LWGECQAAKTAMKRLADEPEAGRDVDDASAPRARMCGRTAFVMRMAPRTLMSKTLWSLLDGGFLGGAR
jgi:hypothetical protein